jgi:putative selenium metabolism hydrolase
MDIDELARTIRDRVAAQREALEQFLREICAIPSMDSQIGPVGERIAREMRALDYDEVRFDRMGNVLGRIGAGPRVLVYDSHIDTVGLGDRSSWGWDPFQGKVEGGVLFARGACDEKGSTPGMVYGLALARELGLLDGLTVYYFGNMEEVCDGIAPNTFAEVDPGVRPDAVVIGEPTRLQVYRGHKGRVELQIIAKGRSAHAASNWLGDNALYKLLPVIAGVRDLDGRLPSDAFLGKATISATDLRVSTVSLNAVPDEAVVFIDRRLTFGETRDGAIAEVQALLPAGREDLRVELLHYEEPSYTGLVFPVDKYFPAWALEEAHPLVATGQRTIEALWGETRPTGKWEFSTNGTYWAGKAGIPSIGFGPGDEVYAHTVLDQVRLDDVVAAAAWYALFPALLPA